MVVKLRDHSQCTTDKLHCCRLVFVFVFPNAWQLYLDSSQQIIVYNLTVQLFFFVSRCQILATLTWLSLLMEHRSSTTSPCPKSNNWSTQWGMETGWGMVGSPGRYSCHDGRLWNILTTCWTNRTPVKQVERITETSTMNVWCQSQPRLQGVPNRTSMMLHNESQQEVEQQPGLFTPKPHK